jgi:hypothetical protein
MKENKLTKFSYKFLPMLVRKPNNHTCLLLFKDFSTVGSHPPTESCSHVINVPLQRSFFSFLEEYLLSGKTEDLRREQKRTVEQSTNSHLVSTQYIDRNTLFGARFCHWNLGHIIWLADIDKTIIAVLNDFFKSFLFRWRKLIPSVVCVGRMDYGTRFIFHTQYLFCEVFY